MAKKKHVDLTRLMEIPMANSSCLMLDKEALLDIQIALCHYHERVCQTIAEIADMKVASELGAMLSEIQSVHDELEANIDELSNQ